MIKQRIYLLFDGYNKEGMEFEKTIAKLIKTEEYDRLSN